MIAPKRDPARQCQGKVPYPRQRDAKKALGRIATVAERPPDRRLEVYQCPHCCLWHIGGRMKARGR